MSNNGNLRKELPGARCSPRVYSVRNVTISYEGQDEQIVVKPPNLSRRGMFVNTTRAFPEGAVLNLKVSLVLTAAEIRTRCEVRYCQPGVGIGVEFVGLTPDDAALIDREISLSTGKPAPLFARRNPKKAVPRRHRKRQT